MWQRLLAMLRKEFIVVLRDPRMRAILLVVPIVQVLVFGYAVTTDVRDVRTALYDQDASPRSRELAARFFGSGYFTRTAVVSSDAEVATLLDRGTVRAVLHVGRGFGNDVDGGRTGVLQLLLDGTDSNTAGIVLGYAGTIAADFNRSVLAARAARQPGSSATDGPLRLESRAWFNGNLESRNTFVPGVIALLVMVISLMLSSMAIVREKEVGTIEQVMVTPIRRSEFILGKTLPFALIGFADVILITVVAVFWFHVPIRGSLALLFGATALYLMSMLGVGLFISTVSSTQQQAMLTAFFFNIPAILLSGFLYPIANMPAAIRWLTFFNPLRYYLVVIRSIFLKGTGFSVLWPQFLGLLILGVAMLALATARFHKTAEG